MEIKKRLLMVNDDMVEMDSLPLIFARRGIDTVVVGSVKEALGQLKNGKFDLVITDIALNGSQTGIDLIKEVRKTDKDTKIAVATGYGDHYQKAALEAGANFYFEKPLDFQKHVLEPIGVEIPPVKEEKKTMPANEQQFTLRKAVHEIGNRHNGVILISSLLKEKLSNLAKEEKFSAKVKAAIAGAIDDLSDVEKSGKAADALLKTVREAVYEKVNPDDIIVKE